MRDLLEANPIIGAIKSDECIKRVVESDCEIVFLLNGDIMSLKEKVELLHKHDKKVFVHIDMITGISSNPIIIDYLKKESNIDGIITTKTNVVKRAVEVKLDVVQRFFFIDSMSLENALESLRKVKPQAIEIMPGVLPKVIKILNKEFSNIPIICGGLIDEKDEIIKVLSCGAMAVSTSKYEIW